MAINQINGNTLLNGGSFSPCRAASTGSPLNPATGGLLVVDGVQLNAGDRVLVKDETSAVNNGIYAANTGPWVRTTDAIGNTQFFDGMKVTVAAGAVNGGQDFICTCTDDPVVVGTSLLTFALQSVVETATVTATSTSSVSIDAAFAVTPSPNGTVLQGQGASNPIFTATPQLGVAGSSQGSLGFAGLTSGVVTVEGQAAAGTWTLKLPTTAGTNNYVLTTDGTGVTNWAAQTGGGGGTPGGSSGQVQYNNSGAFGGFTVSGDGTLNTSTGALTVTKTNGTSLTGLATASPTAHGVLIGEGSSAPASVTLAGGQIVIGQASGDPSAETVGGDATLSAAGSLTVTKTNGASFGALATLGVGTGLTSSGGNLNLTNPVTVSLGGTGLATLTAHAVMLGEGTGNVAFATIGTSGRLLIDQGAGADPSFNAMSGDATITSGGALTVANSAITNAKQANMAAWTIKMNPTSGSAAPSDQTIDGLTLKASPASSDEVILWDVAGSAIKKATVSAIASGVSSIAGNTGAFTLGAGLTNSTNVLLVDPSYFQNFIAGLVLSNDGTTPNSVLDIAAGVATDSTNAVLMKIAAFTKSTAGAWTSGTGNNGMGNGLTIANSTWYHVILANNGGTPDIYFDTSATGANRPSGISDTKVRRIGSFKTDGSAHIIAFTQQNNYFEWAVLTQDIATTNPGTSAVLATMTVPLGVNVIAFGSGNIKALATGDNNAISLLITDPAQTDTAAASNVFSIESIGTNSTNNITGSYWQSRTNTSSQIRYRLNVSSSSIVVDLQTVGWIDYRGQ